MPHVRCDIEMRVHICQRLVSIHAPRAGRDTRLYQLKAEQDGFNPRAPCGARPESFEAAIVQAVFQSTRPVRGATFHLCDNTNFPIVSIHAPHAGRDRIGIQDVRRPRRFNPRAPCGARRRAHQYRYDRRCFNPRAPCGARRWQSVLRLLPQVFQSTRPVRGATRYECLILCAIEPFQSTRPVRGATDDSDIPF